MRYDDDEDREDLAPARRPRRPRRGWSGTGGQRARAAQGLPPAVFKITSYSHSAAGVWSRFAYISRAGELEAEGPNGERFELEELEQVLAEWEGRGKHRLAMSALVTFPRGTDEARGAGAEIEGMLRRWRQPELELAGAVGKDVGRAIRELGTEPDVQREARAARRPLAEQLAAHRLTPERRWSREAARPGPWDACQALEYAKTAGQAAVQLGALTTDPDRVAAVEGAVQLARFAWELTSKEQGRPEERAHAREIIDKTERSLRFAIQEIADPQAQKQAIQARQRLYKAGVQEYRQERQAEREIAGHCTR